MCTAHDPKARASRVGRAATAVAAVAGTLVMAAGPLPPATASTPVGEAPATSAAPATSGEAQATSGEAQATSGEAQATSGEAQATRRGGCRDNLAARLSRTGLARQLLTVQAAGYSSVVATLQLWQRAGGCWEAAGGPWTALIGRNGFSDHHREGDGTTPTGIYGIGPEMYGNAANPGTEYPYHRLVCGDWWDEDPTSAGYNTFQHLPCGQAPPFGGAKRSSVDRDSRLSQLRRNRVQHPARHRLCRLGHFPSRRYRRADRRLRLVAPGRA